MDLEEFLKVIPKAELHVHLTGSVFPKPLEALAKSIMSNYRNISPLKIFMTAVNLKAFYPC